MIPQTNKSWRDYRALNQNWSYQPTLAGRAIIAELRTTDLISAHKPPSYNRHKYGYTVR